jgi:hypothetical protein
MTQLDLPLSDTRAEARTRALRRAETLRLKAFNYIQSCGKRGATADEVAAKLGESVLSVRPRITELFRKSRTIFDSGKRRHNISGSSARVFVVAQYQQAFPKGTAGPKSRGPARDKGMPSGPPLEISPRCRG